MMSYSNTKIPIRRYLHCGVVIIQHTFPYGTALPYSAPTKRNYGITHDGKRGRNLIYIKREREGQNMCVRERAMYPLTRKYCIIKKDWITSRMERGDIEKVSYHMRDGSLVRCKVVFICYVGFNEVKCKRNKSKKSSACLFFFSDKRHESNNESKRVRACVYEETANCELFQVVR